MAPGYQISMDNWWNFDMKFPIIYSGLYESEVTPKLLNNINKGVI